MFSVGGLETKMDVAELLYVQDGNEVGHKYTFSFVRKVQYSRTDFSKPHCYTICATTTMMTTVSLKLNVVAV